LRISTTDKSGEAKYYPLCSATPKMSLPVRDPRLPLKKYFPLPQRVHTVPSEQHNTHHPVVSSSEASKNIGRGSKTWAGMDKREGGWPLMTTVVITSCYSNCSQRPHRCCALLNKTENIKHGQILAWPSIAPLHNLQENNVKTEGKV